MKIKTFDKSKIVLSDFEQAICWKKDARRKKLNNNGNDYLKFYQWAITLSLLDYKQPISRLFQCRWD